MSKKVDFIKIDVEQNTQEWLEIRKESFNASETPILFGLNPFEFNGYKDLYKLKNGIIEVKDNVFMQAGRDNEAGIREQVSKMLNKEFEPLFIAMRTDDRYKCSLDGYCKEDKTILEIKYSAKTYKALENDNMPTHYYLQVQHQLMVSGANKCYFAVAKPKKKKSDDYDILIREIKADEKIILDIYQEWKQFDSWCKTYDPLEDTENEVIEIKEDEDVKELKDILKKSRELKSELDKLDKRKKEIVDKLTTDKKDMYISKDLEIAKIARKSKNWQKIAKELKSEIELDLYYKDDKYYKKSTYYTVREIVKEEGGSDV